MANKRSPNKQKIHASPIARAPEPRPQQDMGQFANGPENQQDPAGSGPSLISEIIRLQRTVGNRAISRQVKHSHGGSDSKIQRLMTTENYLYQYTLPARGIEVEEPIWTSNSHDESALVLEMTRQPFWNKLLGAVRIYDLFQRQKFTRAGLGTLQDLLKPILVHASSFDAWVYKKRRDLPGAIFSMATNVVDDAQQEQKALQAAGTDYSIPDGAITYQQALFFARTGTKFSDVLTEGDLATDPMGGEAGMPKNFSGGNVSTVTGLTYDTGEEKVFKPNETAPAVRDDGTNIDFLSAQTAIRAIATSRVQDLIKLKMEEAGREFTKVITSFDFAMYKGELGTSAEMAEGSEASSVMKDTEGRMTGMMDLNIDISDVEVQRQLANLQLFDILTAQSDRNPGNIMIKQKQGEKSKVQGIDQDFSFTDDNDITKNVGKTTLPALIDRYFAEAILAITKGEFIAALKGLPKTSFDAALTRFSSIKKYLSEMDSDNSLLVAPGDTDHPGARTWGDVQPEEYRNSKWGTGAKDYAGAIRDNVQDALNACKQDPKIQPKQVMKGGKQIWVIEYARGSLLRARNDDGSDLFALVQDARNKRLDEKGFGYSGGNQVGGRRPALRIGGGRNKN